MNKYHIAAPHDDSCNEILTNLRDIVRVTGYHRVAHAVLLRWTLALLLDISFERWRSLWQFLIATKLSIDLYFFFCIYFFFWITELRRSYVQNESDLFTFGFSFFTVKIRIRIWRDVNIDQSWRSLKKRSSYILLHDSFDNQESTSASRLRKESFEADHDRKRFKSHRFRLHMNTLNTLRWRYLILNFSCFYRNSDETLLKRKISSHSWHFLTARNYILFVFVRGGHEFIETDHDTRKWKSKRLYT